MNPFLRTLTGAVCLTLAAACHKSDPTLNHSHPLLTTSPAIWRWVESDRQLGPGTGVIRPKPDSLVLLALQKNDTYSVSENNVLTSYGTYEIDTTQTVITGGSILVDSFLVFNPPPVLSSETGLPAKVYYRTGHDTLYLQSLPTPAGMTTNIFVTYP